MLQLSYINQHPEEVIKGLERKLVPNAAEIVNSIIEVDAKRRATQTQLDETLAESNSISKQIGMLMKQGKKEEAEAAKQATGNLKDKSQELKEELRLAEEKAKELLVQLPNIPSEKVPDGKTPEDNAIVFSTENNITLPEGSLPHWELIKKYDIIDFDLGSKITGAGFPVYKGKGARLQRALINFFLDQAIEAGYGEIQPPIMINEDSAFATGQLPDKEGQMYHDPNENLYLIPTAEVPLTNIYRNEMVDANKLPIKITGYTPCFRREAGSWGAHVRGLNRLHQFDKVELVQIVKPENSYDILEEMTAHVEGLLKKLELPYRKLNLCGGDLGFTAAMTYDLETYSAAQDRWLEVSSVSNFETYQANRLKLRYKDGKQKGLCHTLNGSALALPRILATILENNQTEDGINIPKVLQSYCGFDKIS